MPDVKSWLQSLNTLAGTRVFFRLPVKPSKAPFMRLTRLGGAPDANSETPTSTLRVSIEVWGTDNSDYDNVRKTVLAVEQAVHVIGFSPTPIGSQTTVMWAVVDNSHDSPDPDTGWPRIIILARFGFKYTPG